jgi:hypothetical protein
MIPLRRTLSLVIALALTVLAPATVFGGTSCRNINATGVGQDLGGGQTVGQITDGGLLQGTTAASFAITGISGTVASFAGPITFTTNRATLTANLVGTLDVVSGAFSAASSSISGTGKLAGATGSLSFSGVENLSTGVFTEVVSGSICVDLAP